MYRKLIILVIGISSILSAADSSGYGSNYTHPAITVLAVDSMIKDGALERYLKDDIDLKDGLGTQFIFHSEFSDS